MIDELVPREGLIFVNCRMDGFLRGIYNPLPIKRSASFVRDAGNLSDDREE
jgi:hypothetical protein